MAETVKFTKLEAEAAAMREALEEIAREQSAVSATAAADKFQNIAKDALSPDAGKRMLAVVEAAKDTAIARLGPLPDVHCDLDMMLDRLEKALAALEKP